MLELLQYLRAAEDYASVQYAAKQDASKLAQALAALDYAQKAYWRAVDA